ncbi:MAG: hypothetical protein EOP11_20340, partial [Proteobacteria bacterium]
PGGKSFKWDDIAKRLPGRSSISCRLRYQNYLEKRAIWDEEKKKYFLITADHAVESRQKYTKSNVRHEKQVAKRRKLEQRHEKKRQAQTIKRSRLLSIPEYAGVGLHREIGGRSSALAQFRPALRRSFPVRGPFLTRNARSIEPDGSRRAGALPCFLRRGFYRWLEKL